MSSRSSGAPSKDTTEDRPPETADHRRLLIERIAASSVLSKSARLRDLLAYLCDRALQGNVEHIGEQEVGHQVFGRQPDYDTTADNIVRVHASLLRKRLTDYFSKEGAQEPIVVEIPKGNYALVFRERAADAGGVDAAASRDPSSGPRRLWTMLAWALPAGTALLVGIAGWLLLQGRQTLRGAPTDPAPRRPAPTVHLLWSQLFEPNRQTDIVLDDAGVGIYQDLTKHPIALSEYFDRSYLRKLPDTAEAAKVDRDAAATLLTRRASSYATVAPLWKLFQISASEHSQPRVLFARDYSFHALKTNHAILLGTSQSNPWIGPFESRLGIRWTYDRALESYFPFDTWADDPGGKLPPRSKAQAAQAGDARESYCAVSLLPNLGATGRVLVMSATGGSAIAACADFLADEPAISALRRRLGGGIEAPFPDFEVLLGIKGRGVQPRDIVILVSRTPRG